MVTLLVLITQKNILTLFSQKKDTTFLLLVVTVLTKDLVFHLEGKEVERKSFTKEDLVKVVQSIIDANDNPEAVSDDIDHLGSRRVRFVGEIIEGRIRTGMIQVKRNIQDRMSVVEADTNQPTAIVNQRPLQARIKEFFATNQLSQFMNQDNLLGRD
jgi:DNA-directed RNA polymerase beta subunit